MCMGAPPRRGGVGGILQNDQFPRVDHFLAGPQSGFYPGPQGRYLTRFGYPRGDILPSGSAPGFSHPDLRVFSGKTGMVAKCLGRGLVGGMGTLCCALLLVWYRCFVFMAPPHLLNALAMPPGLVLYVGGVPQVPPNRPRQKFSYTL